MFDSGFYEKHRAPILFTVMAGLLILVGFIQSWGVS